MIVGLHPRLVFVPLGHLYFAALAFIFGWFALAGMSQLLSMYFVVAYVVVGVTLISVVRGSQDCLNPLLLVLCLGIIRFTVPGFLALRSDPEFLIFQMMGLEKHDWILGHALALVGFLGVIVGWLMPVQLLNRRREIAPVRRSVNVGVIPGMPYLSILGMLIGFVALLVFVRTHMSFSEAVTTGEMRATEIQEGSGKYFYLSFMLIASSVVFAAYLLERRYAWWIIAFPAVVAAALFWVLGGRVRTFVPIACVGLLLWYRRREIGVPVKTGVVLTLVILPMFSYVGGLYRGGLGVDAFARVFSVSALADYASYAVWLEWGQLHSLAAAIAIGPGVLGGQTFTHLLWPLTKFLPLPGKSSGVFMVETLVGYGGEKWSFHATLIGDAYLNFGTLGVFIVTAVFGFLLKNTYTAFKQGVIGDVYYTLGVVYGLRIFFETVEKWGEGLVMIVFAFILMRVAPLLFDIRSNKVTRGANLGVSR